MTRDIFKNTVNTIGIEGFFQRNDITQEEIDAVTAHSTNAEKIEATVELFAAKKIPTFSAVELGVVTFYPESDITLLKKRSHAALSYMLKHKRPLLNELNLSYTQYLRLITQQTSTNMHEMLGYAVIDGKLEKVSDPIYQFKPSDNDWHSSVSLPYPINETASVGLGIMWQSGVVQDFVPPELRTIVYAHKDDKDLLANKVRKVFEKMFNTTFRSFSYPNEVIYPLGEKAEYPGLYLQIQSMAIGTFLTETAGLPIGDLYSSNRKELPKLDYEPAAFLRGYKLLMPNSKNRWFAVTQELATELSDILIQTGTRSRLGGSTSPHCYMINTG